MIFPKSSAKIIFLNSNDYYSSLLKATREDFSVKGSKRYAVLDFSDVEQRILTLNKIDDRIQEDLVKVERSLSCSSSRSQCRQAAITVPAPTKNVYLGKLQTELL